MALCDFAPHQIIALEYSGSMLGEYLEEIGVTDIAKLSHDQFKEMLYVVISNYNQKQAEYCPF